MKGTQKSNKKGKQKKAKKRKVTERASVEKTKKKKRGRREEEKEEEEGENAKSQRESWAERRKKKEEGRRKKKKKDNREKINKKPKSISDGLHIPAETGRNKPKFWLRWNMGVPCTSLHAGTRFSVRSGWNRTEYATLVYIGSYNLSLFLYLLFGLIINSGYFVYLGSRVEISYPPKIYNSYVHIDAFFLK